MKAYAILKVGYEYNDEIYHTGNHGESYDAPTNAYKDLDEAKKIKEQLETSEFKGNNLGYYCYGIDEILKNGERGVEEFNIFWRDNFDPEIKIDKGDDYSDYYEYNVPTTATDEQIKQLQSMCVLNFYTLKEIEIN
tara:strand:+ start:32 stop:439 length:408 start_codon:yes stop_codon:yes gene_type:complete